MTMSTKEGLDVIAVSKIAQTDAVTAAVLDKLFLLDEGSAINLDEGREHNQGEKTGFDEPTRVDQGIFKAGATLIMRKATPDFLAWLFAYLTGNCSSVAAGATGYLATSQIKHGAGSSYVLHPKYFTLAHRRGTTADMRRFIGNAINDVRVEFAQGAPLGVSADAVGIGLAEDQKITDTIVADKEATTLTLTHKVQDEDITMVAVMCDLDADGIYEKVVTPVSVENDTKVLTITAPGTGVDHVNYKVRYLIDNSETGHTWANISALTAADEFVIQTNNVKITMFGKGGNATFSDGQVVLDEIIGLTYGFSWNQRVAPGCRTAATYVQYSQSVKNRSPLQTITFDREVRDYLLDLFWSEGPDARFGLEVEAIGPEYESGQAFMFKIIVPLLAMLDKPWKVSESVHVEAGTCVALKDTSVNNLPTVSFLTRNQQASYLA